MNAVEAAGAAPARRRREAVAVFHDEASLQAAVDDLLIAGFDRADFSLVAGHETVEKKLGHMYERVTEVEDDPAVPTLAYVGPDSRTEAKSLVIGGLGYVGAVASAGLIVASGGTVAAALVGAALAGGAGGVIGAALSRYIDRHHAEYLQEQLDRGGLLLWVHTPDPEHERRALQNLSRHSAEDVHIHDLPDVKFQFRGGQSYDMSFMKALGL